MTPPAPPELFRAIEDTWPPAAVVSRDGWCTRMGVGGGQRVSAATVAGEAPVPDIAAMEAVQREIEQHPLVMVRSGEEKLDAALSTAGYELRDTTLILVAPTDILAGETAPIAPYPAWPPLAAQEEIWAEGGVGPERIAVMVRVSEAKTSLMGRLGDEIVATAFVARSGRIAMLHGLEVAPSARRKGVGVAMMRAAGNWAASMKAPWFSVLVVKANTAAVALYGRLGMTEVARYHYRRAPEAAA